MAKPTLQRTKPDVVPRVKEGPPEPGRASSAQVRVQGLARRYVLYMPSSVADAAPPPLLLNLHGSTSYAEEQLWLSGARAAAERHHIAVVAPEAVERSWNVPAEAERPCDVLYLNAVVSHVRAQLGQESACSLFATGFSGGARMLGEYAARGAHPLAAMAPVGGVRPPTGCALERVPAGIAFHGALDQINPYAGGGLPHWQSGVEEAMAAWAGQLGASPAADVELEPGVTQRLYTGGRQPLERYCLAQMGHHWPGCSTALGAPFDPPSTAVNATETMLAFFAGVSAW